MANQKKSHNICGPFSKLRKYVLGLSVNNLSTVYYGFIRIGKWDALLVLRDRD
jgi:hypothetical protein